MKQIVKEIKREVRPKKSKNRKQYNNIEKIDIKRVGKNKKEWLNKKNWSTRQRPTFPHLKGAVLSAMRGLASGFGMGPGVSLSL